MPTTPDVNITDDTVKLPPDVNVLTPVISVGAVLGEVPLCIICPRMCIELPSWTMSISAYCLPAIVLGLILKALVEVSDEAEPLTTERVLYVLDESLLGRTHKQTASPETVDIIAFMNFFGDDMLQITVVPDEAVCRPISSHQIGTPRCLGAIIPAIHEKLVLIVV